jgi:hypothetical protein
VSKRLPFVKSDIPRDLRMFLDRVRELVSGSGADRLISLADLTQAGIAGTDSTGTLTAPVMPYLATPPVPTNVTATAGVNTVFVEFDTPAYRGHAYAEIWGASTDSFAAAVLLGLAPGGIYVDDLGPAATRYYWVRFVNTNDVKGPFNATDGVTATTVPALEYTMDVLAKEYGDTSEAPFFQLDSPLVIDGVTIPAGTYIKSAFIYDGVITNAKIGALAVDSAKIASLAVSTAKITDLAVNTAKIADLAVNTAKIADLAVNTAKIADLAVSTAKIDNLAVSTAKITDLAVNTAKITDLAVTTGKIGNLAVQTLKIGDQAVSTTKYNVFNYASLQPSTLTVLSSYSIVIPVAGDYIIFLSIGRTIGLSGFVPGSSTLIQTMDLVINGTPLLFSDIQFDYAAISVTLNTRVYTFSAGTHTIDFRYRLTLTGPGTLSGGITQARIYIFGAYK